MFLRESIFTWQRGDLMRPSCNVAGTAEPPWPKVWNFWGKNEDEKEKTDLAKLLLFCFHPTFCKRGLGERGRRRVERWPHSARGRLYEIEFSMVCRERCQKVRRPWQIETNRWPDELTTRCLRHCITIQLAFKRALGRLVLFYFAG